jgi:serine/threonine protein kinase
MEHLTRDPDGTWKELSDESQASYVQSETEVTLRYNGPDEKTGSVPSALNFRGWTILEQLPTKGAEADIYLVQVGQECCVLKLYRHRLEPKIEVLNRVSEMSRNYSRCFVVFREVGFDERTGRWYELQEYIPLGSLRDIPPETKRTPSFVRDLVTELTEAIHCLHLNEIIHCDIKPANILVRSLVPLDLVLTDFGISSILASDMSQKMTTLKGTPMYWAPEAFSRVIGRPCDWWGLGMIALELLVGEHPFEGLTDSQIIHKLTVGNVEVPDSIAPDEALLIKGLLTKDDARRWGHEEVVRWLSGARDISVHYEKPQIPKTSRQTPFRFEGLDYTTEEELAQVFAGNEKPWLSGLHYLRYIRQWLESNMLFDEATELGNTVAQLDAERALFRFVHSNAKCPFSLLGKLIDADNLYFFLGRVIHREASSTEARIVNMLGSGQLLSFYDEYVSLSSSRTKNSPSEISGKAKESFFYRLLLLMNKKTLLEQWEYFQALRNPDTYLWPQNAALKSMEETLDALESMTVLPVKRDTFESLKKNYILPGSLLSLFHSPETYAKGAAQLDSWQTQELLIPMDFTSDSARCANLSLDEYAQTARIRSLGHTSAILEKLDFLIDGLPMLRWNEWWGAGIFTHTVDRLKELKSRKITSIDLLFISKVVGLLTERSKIRYARGVQCGIAGCSGGSLSWIIRIVTGKNSDLFFMLIYIAVLWGGVFGLVAYSEWARDLLAKLRRGSRSVRDPVGYFGLVVLAIIGFLSLSFLSFRRLLLFFPNIFPFSEGILLGGMLGYVWNQRALSRNTRSIADACDAYSGGDSDARPVV